MSHEKVSNEKSGKKTPVKNLMEKRAARAAKRDEKRTGLKIEAPPLSSTSKN
jgi:hypothetical protein